MLCMATAGTGKTSMVTALAGALGLDVYVVTLSSPSMSDETLRSLLNSAADRCVQCPAGAGVLACALVMLK